MEDLHLYNLDYKFVCLECIQNYVEDKHEIPCKNGKCIKTKREPAIFTSFSQKLFDVYLMAGFDSDYLYILEYLFDTPQELLDAVFIYSIIRRYGLHLEEIKNAKSNITDRGNR